MTHLPFALLLSGDGEALSLAVRLLIIFGSAKLLAELCERMGQPGIIGEILAGVLIGPSVLGWVQPDAFTHTMASLGVLFLLFRVGLEVEAEELIKLGGTAVAVGVLGVVIPFLAGFVFYWLAGREQMEAVFLGSALTATSVGITAQVLAARNLLHRTAAKIVLGAAIIDDILALLLLGGVSSIANGTVNVGEIALTTFFAVAFIAIVARWGHQAVGEVTRRIGGQMQSGEAEFAFAMVFLFALAALSEKVGVAAIIGAFLAGMAISKSVPPRVHDLAHGVTELLVPFFLAEIGLHFRLEVFQDSRVVILAFILIPVAILSKLFGCGLGALRHGKVIATRVGAGMIPRGEFCMVVAQTGLALGALKADTYAMIVLMAVVAATIAPPMLHWAFRGVLRPDEALTEVRTIW
jgi:Kef-type K+ transport system membrane component KefB